ncbi:MULTISPECIES: ATP-binding protein [Streptomyces]|jgi:anti-sigma regulatory factor (Ser/Thr protein kinase)|uniref:ATP-binding protein n=1 Tax=Streptomyces griseoaurantiacus TaxID=68213 RepID=A0A1G7W0J0_9ACTN|nr:MULTISPECIES: ATP-binding protein [Streptomyces]MDX3088447.1 ATP-binding protein [Streptomyces sp. ME12-02E]MDX3332024.1 ATP-binding protein [Streptomyces sp. ME02-6978a]SDG65368.1 Histidine kinase-like ATPase domain-containing protein [Streptomyces jietaisiensis]
MGGKQVTSEAPRETTGERSTGEPSRTEASLALSGDSTRLAQVRRFAASFLTTARGAAGVLVRVETVEAVQLIVSELVTNALRHAPGPALLGLSISDGALRIEVSDSSPVAPAARVPDPARVGQHGLEMVTALARSVSVETAATGKRVVAVVALA